jgi:uncharacterized protein HemX
LENSGAAADLVGLAKRCLSPEPADRPRNANEVATASADHRAGVEARARRAELERAAAETRVAEERKRRRVQLALAAAILLLVGLGGGGAWWLQQQRQARQEDEARRRDEAAHAVDLVLNKARLMIDRAKETPLAGDAELQEALTSLLHAEELAERAGAGQDILSQVSCLAISSTRANRVRRRSIAATNPE